MAGSHHKFNGQQYVERYRDRSARALQLAELLKQRQRELASKKNKEEKSNDHSE